MGRTNTAGCFFVLLLGASALQSQNSHLLQESQKSLTAAGTRIEAAQAASEIDDETGPPRFDPEQMADPPACDETTGDWETKYVLIDKTIEGNRSNGNNEEEKYAPGVKVWWKKKDKEGEENEKGKKIALATLAHIENVAWPVLTKLMNRKPLSDKERSCNGGDSLLDVYIIYGDTGRVKAHMAEQCTGTSAYILIGDEEETLPDTVVHEFFHVLQHTRLLPEGCLKDPEHRIWWTEATAIWAIDYVETEAETKPYRQFEHKWAAEDYYCCITESIDSRRGYGAYLFPFYLARSLKDDTIIREIWNEMVNAPDTIAAITNTLCRDQQDKKACWRDYWLGFSTHLLNFGPVAKFEEWDDLTERNTGIKGGKVTLSAPVEIDIFPRMQYLTSQTYKFEIDDAVRAVWFQNLFHGEEWAHIGVSALIKVTGQGWQGPLNWSGQGALLCRDLPEQRVEGIILVFANSALDDDDLLRDGPYGAKLLGTDVGCWRYRGGSKVVESLSWPDGDTRFETTATVHLERVVTPVPAAPGPFSFVFRPVDGSVHFESQGTAGYPGFRCRTTVGPASTQITSETAEGGLYIENVFGTERSYQCTGMSKLVADYYTTCPVDDPPQTEVINAGWMTTGRNPRPVDKGDFLQGKIELVTPMADSSMKYDISEWYLKALRKTPTQVRRPGGRREPVDK